MSAYKAQQPAVIVALGFLVVIAVSTCVLALPISRAQPQAPVQWLAMLFAATSAVCVTGFSVVDSISYWSTFGLVAQLVMVQIGGMGMMVSASALGLWMARSLQLRTRMLMQSEMHALSMGDVRSLFRVIVIASLGIELLLTVWLTARLMLGYGMPLGHAAWVGLFHAVSAFNNAGMSTFSDSMVGFAADGWMLMPLMFGVVIGGLGFPVLHELWSRVRMAGRPPRLSVHAQMTLLGTVLLLAFGAVGVAAFEWNSGSTLAPLSAADKWVVALFTSTAMRSAGFNAIDVSALQQESLMFHNLLMFIGAGSAGSASGIKVTTAGVLLAAVWSEIRGCPDVEFAGRRIAWSAVRLALTVLVLGVSAVGVGTLMLLPMTNAPYEHVLFEVVSAFGTVGLTTGITAALPPAGQGVMIALMYIGRVGLVTVATSLALNAHRASYRYPEEKVIVG